MLFLALLTWCIEDYWTEFHQKFTGYCVFEAEGELVRFWMSWDQSQGHSKVAREKNGTPYPKGFVNT